MQGESLILNAEETRDDRVVENLLRSVLGRKYLWGTEVEEQRDTGRRGKFWAFTCKKHTRGLTWFRHELLPEEFKASDDNAVYTYDGGTGVLNLSRLRLVRVLPHDDRHNLTIHSLHPCQCARSMPHYQAASLPNVQRTPWINDWWGGCREHTLQLKDAGNRIKVGGHAKSSPPIAMSPRDFDAFER